MELQNSLLEKFKAPLLTVRANYPGENKWESIPIEITDIVAKEMVLLFEDKITHTEILKISKERYIFSLLIFLPLRLKKILYILKRIIFLEDV